MRIAIVIIIAVAAVAVSASFMEQDRGGTADDIPLWLQSEPRQTGLSILGHVEYTVLDDTGAVKHYLQVDNVIVEAGKDCVSRMVFGTSTGCPEDDKFQYIAVGNHTSDGTPAVTLTGLEEETDDNDCAATGDDGEMARKQVSPAFTAAAGGTGTIVVLETSDPFTFGASNSTTVMQSGIFNGPNAAVNNDTGECETLGTARMFAVQDIDSDDGIEVSDGDSLSVKWTITIG